MLEFLVGECGKSEYQAYFEVTYSEYLLLQKAFQMREHRSWERTRMLAYNHYLLTATKGVKCRDIRKFYPLPMDEIIRSEMHKDREYDVVTKREKERVLKLLKRV